LRELQEQRKTRNALGQAVIKAAKSMYNMLPILGGVILLISLVNAWVPKTLYTSIFSKNPLLDVFIGDVLGSILAGNPITSYILGGELLAQGVTLLAVTAFIVAWVTVGIIQLPAEALILGKRFAITRIIISFGFTIIIAIITVLILGIII